jgi:hypothetical protein
MKLWNPFRPKHTVASVARALAAGLRDGSITLEGKADPPAGDPPFYGNASLDRWRHRIVGLEVLDVEDQPPTPHVHLGVGGVRMMDIVAGHRTIVAIRPPAGAEKPGTRFDVVGKVVDASFGTMENDSGRAKGRTLSLKFAGGALIVVLPDIDPGAGPEQEFDWAASTDEGVLVVGPGSKVEWKPSAGKR